MAASSGGGGGSGAAPGGPHAGTPQKAAGQRGAAARAGEARRLRQSYKLAADKERPRDVQHRAVAQRVPDLDVDDSEDSEDSAESSMSSDSDATSTGSTQRRGADSQLPPPAAPRGGQGDSQSHPSQPRRFVSPKRVVFEVESDDEQASESDPFARARKLLRRGQRGQALQQCVRALVGAGRLNEAQLVFVQARQQAAMAQLGKKPFDEGLARADFAQALVRWSTSRSGASQPQPQQQPGHIAAAAALSSAAQDAAQPTAKIKKMQHLRQMYRAATKQAGEEEEEGVLSSHSQRSLRGQRRRPGLGLP
eukprot:COSAG01_NODE_15900_length_1287_cov_0.905724_1_plen_308_part_00